MRSAIHHLGLCSILVAPSCAAELGGDEPSDLSEDTTGETGETGETEPVDSDQDGLTDPEELELGTDPLDADSDDDNYWDSWELIEGTDPLDYDSRIYTGFWPYQPAKDTLPFATWDEASTEVGAPFPRYQYLDQHGDLVDLHDFAYFDRNAAQQQAYLLIDVAAQWCGPCHMFATWISGDPSEAGGDVAYPTVRQKVQDLRVWWITVIVENAQGGAPTLHDAEIWHATHPTSYIPVLVDADRQLIEHFSGGQFPHFFLIDPAMQIEFFPTDTNSSDYYPALTMISKYL